MRGIARTNGCRLTTGGAGDRLGERDLGGGNRRCRDARPELPTPEEHDCDANDPGAHGSTQASEEVTTSCPLPPLYDKQRGVWQVAGHAKLDANQNAYVADVPHFSAFNIPAPGPCPDQGLRTRRARRRRSASPCSSRRGRRTRGSGRGGGQWRPRCAPTARRSSHPGSPVNACAWRVSLWRGRLRPRAAWTTLHPSFEAAWEPHQSAIAR
jgi:hypothetical protein